MKPIPNFPGYFVDENGVVYSTKRMGGNDRTVRLDGPPRPLSIRRDQQGYCVVSLSVGCKNYLRKIHRLVLEAFVGPCPEGMEGCHHPDPDRSNNKLSNLRWDTHKENHKDAFRDQPPPTEKRCSACKEVKPVSEFYRTTRQLDGYVSHCKACHIQSGKRSLAKRKQEAKSE